METLKAKFLSAYAKVPEPLRSEIIVVLEDKPYNWDSVLFEVRGDSELSKKLLNILVSMDII